MLQQGTRQSFEEEGGDSRLLSLVKLDKPSPLVSWLEELVGELLELLAPLSELIVVLSAGIKPSFILFFCFILLFWNQIFTCVSFSCNADAISIRLALVRYLLKWNSFSSSVSCLFVKLVRPVLLKLPAIPAIGPPVRQFTGPFAVVAYGDAFPPVLPPYSPTFGFVFAAATNLNFSFYLKNFFTRYIQSIFFIFQIIPFIFYICKNFSLLN